MRTIPLLLLLALMLGLASSTLELDKNPSDESGSLGRRLLNATSASGPALSQAELAALGKASSLVVGGTPAALSRFPYMVGIFLPSWGGRGCGGALITNRVVLTAAHCTLESDPAQYTIAQGFRAYYTSSADVGKGARWVRKAAAVVRHPGWSTNPWSCLGASMARNDLALILLDRPVNTARITLPSARLRKPQPPQKLLSIGYGQNAAESASGAYTVASQLQRLLVPVVPPRTCSRQVFGCDPDNRRSVTMSAGLICAGGQAANSAACRGDSGSPLIKLGKTNKQDVLVGIFSFMSTPCGIEGHAGGYTWVAAYRKWILTQVTRFKTGSVRTAG